MLLYSWLAVLGNQNLRIILCESPMTHKNGQVVLYLNHYRGHRIQPYCIQDNHGHAKDGSPFFIVRSGLANLNAMMNLCSPDMVAEWMLFMREPDVS